MKSVATIYHRTETYDVSLGHCLTVHSDACSFHHWASTGDKTQNIEKCCTGCQGRQTKENTISFYLPRFGKPGVRSGSLVNLKSDFDVGAPSLENCTSRTPNTTARNGCHRSRSGWHQRDGLITLWLDDSCESYDSWRTAERKKKIQGCFLA